MEEDILVLIKYVHSYSFSIALAQLTVLIPLPLLDILPLLLLTPRVELVSQEFEIGLLLLLHLKAYPHIALAEARVAQRLELLVDERGVRELVHGDGIAAARSPSLADHGHLGRGELADPARGD